MTKTEDNKHGANRRNENEDEDDKGKEIEKRKSSSRRDRDRFKRNNDKERKSHRSSSRRKSKSDERRRRKKSKNKIFESEKSSRKKKRKKYYSSSSDDDSSSSSSDSSDSDSSSSTSTSDNDNRKSKSNKTITTKKRKVVVNTKLLSKLAARGETLEEREQRRAERRAARITAQFGYTAQDNPFNDPNLADTFTWKKKIEASSSKSGNNNKTVGESDKISRKNQQDKIFHEIEKVRKRRRDYEEQKEEMERIKADESRMKELEKYDEWAQKEEMFHLQQQKHRSAIRLVEGREKPIDVLAKNLLLFGLSEEEKENRASVKYKEKYNALEEVEALEVELEEPHVFITCLKLDELEELLVDIDAFRTLERDVGELEREQDGYYDKNQHVLRYWDFLHLITKAEINLIKSSSNGQNQDDNILKDIQGMFDGQSKKSLEVMKEEVETKIKNFFQQTQPIGGEIDLPYWQTVLDQLLIHLAKMELSEIHSKMLVRQLEKLEQKREDLEKKQKLEENTSATKEVKEEDANLGTIDENFARPKDVDANFGNLEEELGLTSEIDLGLESYQWQEKYRPRKPRYFNRVKLGYDWNMYNKTHYDHDNPPPKIVQGYKFNIFYPDLLDKTNAPKYTLEPTESPEFCIIRFSCGPPYEDIAFKIINRQWNKSRKKGFRCTFERGVLSLYFNFATHWYRR